MVAIGASVDTDLQVIVGGAYADTDTANGYATSANDVDAAAAVTDHAGRAIVAQGVDDGGGGHNAFIAEAGAAAQGIVVG